MSTISTVWNRLWLMHDETKGLMLFRPLAWLKQNQKGNLQFRDSTVEHDVDLADEMDEAPAEHAPRLKSSPNGIEEGEPREYTTRQKVGLFLGPALFVLMLLARCGG